MNTEKQIFGVKSHKDSTHHALLLNLTLHSDNPSSSAHLKSVGIHRMQFEASQENFGHLQSKEANTLLLCHLSMSQWRAGS